MLIKARADGRVVARVDPRSRITAPRNLTRGDLVTSRGLGCAVNYRRGFSRVNINSLAEIRRTDERPLGDSKLNTPLIWDESSGMAYLLDSVRKRLIKSSAVGMQTRSFD